mmetsp:Transcript_6690/g.17902  ORF Transcript_6690/g.17902 Transcript_6690/m.17902 type:complete len:106 (+) Transcript_6690:107-424(+)
MLSVHKLFLFIWQDEPLHASAAMHLKTRLFLGGQTLCRWLLKRSACDQVHHLCAASYVCVRVCSLFKAEEMHAAVADGACYFMMYYQQDVASFCKNWNEAVRLIA